MVNKPIIDDIAIKGFATLDILKPEGRLKNISAIKFANSDHNVKNLNCFPKPISAKTLEPENKNISTTKKKAKERQVTLNSIISILLFQKFQNS